ncbi:diiron oxygenase [Herbaspirillum sp. YR522]|uniref:diiron oxygenase n=1 Tax=Herbaspirillum sp. YR522 TaxID=1144342 RepID=UPI00026FAB18|nr:diiron oxygenase [Herbaspirillum sp. YR522]EJN02814.1 P-aminobenzoate N-oxygenase AurF [Herbaspirillum sp. YR522]
MQYPVPAGEDDVAVMLKKLSQLWRSRAAVNQELVDYHGLAFDPARDDFSSSLLPFRHHPAWTEAPAALRSRCLSYAWAIYNLKTIHIECDVVTPACEDLIKTPPPGCHGALLQDVMSQALLDEALHTRMSIMACNYIYDRRGIAALDFADFNLVRWRAQLLDGCNAQWQRRLTRFAIACASETLITDYLKTMAEDDAIQPICHAVTRTHAADEWSHSSVFSGAAAALVEGMSRQERVVFSSVILKTVAMFADHEAGAWAKVFSMLQFPHGREILEDLGTGDEVTVYTESVRHLIERIGLADLGSEVPSGRAAAPAWQVRS